MLYFTLFYLKQITLRILIVNTVVVVVVAYVLETLYKGTTHFPSAGKKAKQRNNTKSKRMNEVQFLIPLLQLCGSLMILGFGGLLFGFSWRREVVWFLLVCFGVLFFWGFGWVVVFFSLHDLTFSCDSQILRLFCVSDLIANFWY